MSEKLPPSSYNGEKLCLCCGVGFDTGNYYAICADGDDDSRYSHAESCVIYSYEKSRLCDACETPNGSPVSDQTEGSEK